MADPVFTTGDLVSLVAGGPLMTVLDVDGGSISCGWFTLEGHQSSPFPAAALTAASP